MYIHYIYQIMIFLFQKKKFICTLNIPWFFSLQNFLYMYIFLIFQQVFHVCESGKRQSSFLCPKGTIFNQKHRVCDWWYNVKCEDATEFYDLNLDLLLLDKGVSPTQTTSLNVPPPIDPLASIDPGLLGSDLPLELLAGSDAELDSLILDDLVLSNLLGNRRMDTGEDNSGLYADSTASPITKQLPSSVAAPVQPQPSRLTRRKNRRKKKNRRNRMRKKSHGGGGGSLCQIIGICDSVPSATQEEPIQSQHSPQSNVPFAASQLQPLYIEAPQSGGSGQPPPARLGEKTAAEIAQLYAQTDDEYELPMRPITLDDSQFAASSITNTLSIVSPPVASNSTAIDFSDGQRIRNLLLEHPTPPGPEESYRMTFFNTDISELTGDEHFSNVPVSSINFEDYEERKSKMMQTDGDSVADDAKAGDNVLQRRRSSNSDSAFQLEEHNLDREAKTWRPLKMDEEGNVERTDVSDPVSLDQNDWVPKLGPEVKIRETK